MVPRVVRRLLAALAGVAALAPAAAHDSWLSPAPAQADAGLLRLEMAVGARYPKRESPVALASVQRAACQAPGDTRQRPLVPREEHEAYLELRSRIDASRGVACWAELRAWDVELTPQLVAAYLDEVRATEAVRRHWAAQQTRGVPWRESYRKFLRLELPAPAATLSAAQWQQLRKPEGLPFELVVQGGAPLAAGQPASFQALLDGKPLAGQWVEFVSERSALGVWRQTDADGQVGLPLPFPGPWLLRSVVLEPPGRDDQPWRSRFATLLVHVR
jgi:hypothetical protein